MNMFERVELALSEGRVTDALTFSIAEWRRSRAPEVAGAVDALSARIELDASDVFTSRVKAGFHQQWLAAAKEPDDVMVGMLARSIGERVPIETSYSQSISQGYALKKYAALLNRVQALAKLPDDPRVAKALTGLIFEAKQSVLGASASREVYGLFIRGLTHLRDVRAVTVLQALVKSPRAKQESIRSYFSRALPEAIKELQTTRIEPVDERWAGFSATHERPPQIAGSQEQSDFRRQISAEPSNDAIRLVYADWLLERGDPRGEFISLQIQQKDSKRARALLREHESGWLGDPLRATLTKTAFERGFLSEAALAQNAAATAQVWAAAASDERLATVTSLAKGRGSIEHYEAFVMSQAMQNLERVDVLRWSFLDTLLKAKRRAPGLGLPSVPSGANARKTFEVFDVCQVRSLFIEISAPQMKSALALLPGRTFESLSINGLMPESADQFAEFIAALWPHVTRTLRVLRFGRPHAVISRNGTSANIVMIDAPGSTLDSKVVMVRLNRGKM